ncbi:MAG: Hsp20/alpha crystallin family protein [Burkholderiaceae bacterium]|nr:Hsp20/alpha crystallin family protein [Burkholderiaceae bacterium]MCX7902100.1 Hsp20/alpha crystallin family protein [Burkholderiaceae bacterium]
MFESLLSYPQTLFAEFDRLRREVDELFGLAGLPASIRSVAPGAFPAINIGSTPGSVEIYAFAPGIDPNKLEVTVDRGVLTIAGERASDVPEDSDKVSVYSNERFAGRFRRAIALPDDADPSKVEAKYRDGVLHITVGRRESALPKRITVQ